MFRLLGSVVFLLGISGTLVSEEGYEQLNPNALEKYKTIFYTGCDQLLNEPLELDFLDLVNEIVGKHCERVSSELTRLEDKAWKRDLLVGLEPSRAFQESIESLSKDFAKIRFEMTRCSQLTSEGGGEPEGKGPDEFAQAVCHGAKDNLEGLRAYIYAFGHNTLKALKRSIKPAKKDTPEEKKEKSKKEQKRQPKINPYVE